MTEDDEIDISLAMEAVQQAVMVHRRVIRLCKVDNGVHLSPLGKTLIEALAADRMTHADIANILKISRGAVSTYMRKVESGEIQSALRA